MINRQTWECYWLIFKLTWNCKDTLTRVHVSDRGFNELDLIISVHINIDTNVPKWPINCRMTPVLLLSVCHFLTFQQFNILFVCDRLRDYFYIKGFRHSVSTSFTGLTGVLFSGNSLAAHGELYSVCVCFFYIYWNTRWEEPKWMKKQSFSCLNMST